MHEIASRSARDSSEVRPGAGRNRCVMVFTVEGVGSACITPSGRRKVDRSDRLAASATIVSRPGPGLSRWPRRILAFASARSCRATGSTR